MIKNISHFVLIIFLHTLFYFLSLKSTWSNHFLIIWIFFRKCNFSVIINKIFFIKLFRPYFFKHWLRKRYTFFYLTLRHESNLNNTSNFWFKWKITEIFIKFLQRFTCFGVFWKKLNSLWLIYIFCVKWMDIWMSLRKRLINS